MKACELICLQQQQQQCMDATSTQPTFALCLFAIVAYFFSSLLCVVCFHVNTRWAQRFSRSCHHDAHEGERRVGLYFLLGLLPALFSFQIALQVCRFSTSPMVITHIAQLGRCSLRQQASSFALSIFFALAFLVCSLGCRFHRSAAEKQSVRV